MERPKVRPKKNLCRQVIGRRFPYHTREKFIALFELVENKTPRKIELYVILDNYRT